MTENILARLFEHNNWANEQIIQVCAGLSDEQLDAEPQSATMGSLRKTLTHLVAAQRGYLALLTLPPEARAWTPLALSELQESARRSGEGLLALARNTSQLPVQVQSTDGYLIAPWVVMVQVINHATEHREQINNMLSALGVTPPSLDGWSYGEVTDALVLITE
ncbi:MAG: DinB family protein [Chloroflexi bacterium]|nr:DinB family protein [Chloroflexota bacterium]